VWLGWRLRSSLTYPDGSTVLAAYTYDLAGNRLTKELENGTIATSTYDDKGQLTLLAHEKSGATQAAFGYTYNSVGNFLPSKVRDAASGPQQSMPLRAKRGTSKVVNMQSVVRTETTTYDAIDQVTGVNYGNSRSESFLYDAMGNRVSSTDSAAGTTSYTTNAKNQYTSLSVNSVSSVVQHDPKGNLTDSGNGFVYTYDSKNRLLSAVSAGMGVNLAMTYDADNKVVSRTLNGTTRYFIYDGWSLIAEYNSTGSLVKSYVHGAVIDEILVQTQGSTDAFYHHDALGSTVLLTNASGNIVRSYEYDAFGKVSNPPSVDNLFSADPYANRFLYTGREFLKEANLYDYRNRVYSAELGRFLQSDPIHFDAGDGNLYRYVANSPTLQTDPFGLWASASGNHHNACPVCNDGETKTSPVVEPCGIRLVFVHRLPVPMPNYKNCKQDYICSGGDWHPKGPPHSCGRCGDGGLIGGNPAII
jgi:RHS repeat-associated protein